MSQSAFTVTGSVDGTGTVTSVAVASTDLTVAGSPITDSGTINLVLNTVTIAKGGTNITTYAAGDILYATAADTLGKLATANSAVLLTAQTGVPEWSASLTDGQIIIGATGGVPVAASITAGSGVTITPGAGTIEISATGTGGTVTSVTATSPLTSTEGTTPDIALTTVPVSLGGTFLTSVAQGDLLYGSAVDTYSLLNKDANATRYLSNQGADNNPSWNQVNLANGVTGLLPIADIDATGTPSADTFLRGDASWAVPLNSGAVFSVTQANTFVGGELVYLDGVVYELADNSSVATAEAVGMVVVSPAPTPTSFTLQMSGRVLDLGGLGVAPLAPDNVYFVGTAGALTLTPPTAIGSVVKPVLIANTTTSGLLFNWRGYEIEGGISPDVANIVQSVYTTAFTFTDVGTYVDTGMSVTITPSSANSRVRLQFISQFSNTSDSSSVTATLFRDGVTNIGVAGGGFLCTTRIDTGFFGGTVGFDFIDEPNTTDPVTYNLYAQGTLGTKYIGGAALSDPLNLPTYLTATEVGRAGGAGGAIVQSKTSTMLAGSSTSSTSYVDVTGAEFSITPTSAANKILVIMSAHWLVGVTGSNTSMLHKVLRDGSTDLSGGLQSGALAQFDGITSFSTFCFTYLDSPATTSAVTYKIQQARVGGSVTVTTSRVTITLQEITP